MLTPEQIEARRSLIGGSDAAAVLGVKGAFGGPWRVWAQKMGIDLGADEIDPELALVGNALEGPIAALAAERFGAELVVDCPMLRHESAPVGGHPDGYLRFGDRDEGLEVKTIQHGDLADHLAAYEAQCRVYMACAGVERWHLVALEVPYVPAAVAIQWAAMTDLERGHALLGRKPERLIVHTFERDLVLEARLIAALSAWWQRHIVEGAEPDPDDSEACGKVLARRYRDHDEGMIDAPEAADLVEAYRLGAEQEKAGKAAKNEAGNKIKALIGDNKGLLTLAGKVTWSRYGKTNTDWASVAAEHPEIAGTIARFTTSTPTGRLNISKK